MIYELLELDEKWLRYTRLNSIKSAKTILRKTDLKFSEGSKAKSPATLILSTQFLS